MQGHFGIDPPDRPACLAQAHAKLWLFPGDQGWVVAAHFAQGIDPHQRVPPAGPRLAYGGVPFLICKAVVDAGLRKAFAAASADHGCLGMVMQEGFGPSEPTGLYLAIAVDELHEACAVSELVEPGIARPGCCEGLIHLEGYHLGTEIPRGLNTAIGRSGIHVDQRCQTAQGFQTTDQPVAFIAPDDNGRNAHAGTKG